MYKDNIANLTESLESIIMRYSGLYQFSEDSTKYSLIFNRQFASPVHIPKYTEQEIEYACKFYLDDDYIILNIEDMLKLICCDRFEEFVQNTHLLIYPSSLKRDITALSDSLMNILPFAYNNKLKTRNRIRIIKTYTYKNKEKHYYECIGDALVKNMPNQYDDILAYSSIFNDPIKVEALTKGVYCHLDNQQLIAPCYSSNDTSITSIFPAKSNLPERLRMHYTSNLLEPVNPHLDTLSGNCTEKTSGHIVFLPTNFENNLLGKDTLLAGDILINSSTAHTNVYVRRTLTTHSLNLDVVSAGTIVQPNDILAYDVEGNPCLRYTLNYKDALVEHVIPMQNYYKIILKIKSHLGVARLISDYGLKGVTHPRKDLGYFEYENEEFPVDLVVGPNSVKSMQHGIQLSWLNFLNSLDDKQMYLSPENYSEAQVNEMLKSLRKVDWHYQGKTYQVYAGLMSFGVTDLAKDCRVTNIRILSETLKYMFVSNNQYLINAASILLNKHVPVESKSTASNLFKLLSSQIYDDSLPVVNWDNEKLQSLIASNAAHICNWRNIKSTPGNNMLLNMFNDGFYIKFGSINMCFPSSSIINNLACESENFVIIPIFAQHATYLLSAIRRFYLKIIDEGKVYESYNNYLKFVKNALFEKKGIFSSAVCPMVDGGHLKQLVSSHVPKGVTVILDSDLEKKVSDFYTKYKIPIYEIGVRNPVLWRFQFYPRKVWTFGKFKKFLQKQNISIDDILLYDMIKGAVLRNIEDTMFDKSDTDGDLYPISIPLDPEVQQNLHQYILNPNPLQKYEIDWINTYIESETAKNIYFDNVENKPFKYYTVQRDWLSKTMTDAAIAKTKVGLATTQLWQFHCAVEFEYYSGSISYEDMVYLQFLYSRIVQDTVIEGIKHVEGGSSGYDVFILKNISKEPDLILNILIDKMSVSEELANKFINIASVYHNDKIVQLVSRISNGGLTNAMTNNIQLLNNLSEEDMQISYLRIVKNHLPFLLSMYNDVEDTGIPEPQTAVMVNI